mgnify:CR=1 FL=1
MTTPSNKSKCESSAPYPPTKLNHVREFISNPPNELSATTNPMHSLVTSKQFTA